MTVPRKQKKKRTGFTLVELLVAMLCASLVLTMVGGTVVFMTKTTDELIDVSEEAYKISTMKEYILAQNYDAVPTGFTVDTQHKKLLNNGKCVVEHTELLEIIFSEDENFIYCKLIFSEENYQFVAGTKKGGAQ